MLRIFKQIILKYHINRYSLVKIIAGASHTKYSGWISTNIGQLCITKESDFAFLFEKKSIDNLLLEHVIEHLEYSDFVLFLKIAKEYLNKKGIIRIAVPDAYHPSSYVRELTGINGTEPGANDHKYFYSIDDFDRIASEFKYQINKLEYFDKNGKFVKNEYDFENGYISRCSKNYIGRFTNSDIEYQRLITTVPEYNRAQFDKYEISYTSLLVDFINDD